MNQSDKNHIARPYAKAAFNIALGQNRLHEWSVFLNNLAALFKDEKILDLLNNPGLTWIQKAQLCADCSSEKLDEMHRNFIFLLAENKRIEYLPEIAALYEKLWFAQAKVAKVKVTTVSTLEEEQVNKLREALQRHLEHQIVLEFAIDPDLVGGIIVKIGDYVMDASIKNRLITLKRSLMANYLQ